MRIGVQCKKLFRDVARTFGATVENVLMLAEKRGQCLNRPRKKEK
jgi:hypothetical protein